MIQGAPLDPDRVYTLATTGYLAQGNVGYDVMLQHEPSYSGITLLEAVSQHIASVSPVQPDNIVRIIWIEEER